MATSGNQKVLGDLKHISRAHSIGKIRTTYTDTVWVTLNKFKGQYTGNSRTITHTHTHTHTWKWNTEARLLDMYDVHTVVRLFSHTVKCNCKQILIIQFKIQNSLSLLVHLQFIRTDFPCLKNMWSCCFYFCFREQVFRNYRKSNCSHT